MTQTEFIPLFELEKNSDSNYAFEFDEAIVSSGTSGMLSETFHSQTMSMDMKKFRARGLRAKKQFNTEVAATRILSAKVKSLGYSTATIFIEGESFSNQISIQKKCEHFSNRIADLYLLDENWDGYGALAPNSTAIKHAKEFMQTLFEHRCIPTRLAASVVGGVGITKRVKTKKVYIEFYNNGLISALFVDDARQVMRTENVDNSNEYEELLWSMKAYLDV